jgi:hypothetical protein
MQKEKEAWWRAVQQGVRLKVRRMGDGRETRMLRECLNAIFEIYDPVVFAAGTVTTAR